MIINEDKDSKSKALSGLIWLFLERCGAQGVTFVVSIVLARLLDPETYGIVALVTVFPSILGIFINCGIGTALVQKKDSDDLDFSTVFYFNLVVSVLICIILNIVAPFISSFYQRPQLTSILRVYSFGFLISGIKKVQTAIVSKNMIFKKFFFATLGGTIGAAFVGIGMALTGFGVWALVCQDLFNNAIDTIILWLTVKWKPKRLFSFSRLKSLLSFSWKLLASTLLGTFYNNLRALIIGKLYSSEDLAFYNKGNSLPYTIIANINNSIDGVLLPAMSAEQDDRARVRAMTRRALKISTYVMAPCMAGLAVCAEPIVRILLTEKWLPCVPYLRIFCFVYAFWPVHTANLNAINALGRSDWFLRLEIIKKIVGLVAILSTMWFGVFPLALSEIATTITGQIINSWPNKKLLNYRYLDQLKDILPGILLAVFMGACVYCVQFLHLNDWLTLLIQVPMGAVLYIGLSALLKLDSFTYIWGIATGMLRRGRERRKET